MGYYRLWLFSDLFQYVPYELVDAKAMGYYRLWVITVWVISDLIVTNFKISFYKLVYNSDHK